MKECLNCKEQYESKRETSKFCSTCCRVRWYQKYSKGKKKVTPRNMQELYTEMLVLIKKANSEPSQPFFGVASKDETKWGQTQEPVKIRLKKPFLTLQALVNECQSIEEYEPLRKEIEEADHLSDREKAILLRKR